MLELKFIKEHPEIVKRAIQLKGVKLDLEALLACERLVVGYRKEIESLQAIRNSNARQVSRVPPEERKEWVAKGQQVAAEIEKIKPLLDKAEAELHSYLLQVPNIPDPEVPVGLEASSNVEVRRWGTPKDFDFPPLDHVQLLKKWNWAELERIAHIAGSRSYALRNDMVLLELALIQFALEKAQGYGFQILSLPSMVREEALYGTGHFPEGKDQVYSLPNDDLYLAGTAEVPINFLHSREILQEQALPLLYAGFSSCFRREAGSAGRDVRGLIRVHQFYKVELFVVGKNDSEESFHWLNRLLLIAEELMQKLELPYRVIECCTGDMGLGKVRMFDIEAWIPSESRYRETHSCSALHDWQARRSNLRYRAFNQEVRFCHTLNNTAVATPRILVPFLENHQRKDGTIYIPPVLRPFLKGSSSLPIFS